MDIGAIFFTLALLTLVGMFIAGPYMQRGRQRGGRQDHERSALMAEYDRMVNTLQEIDFDNTLGKIPAEDFPIQRAELLAKGAELLRKLDALQPKQESRDTQSRIEAAVATRRADAPAIIPAIQIDDDDLEALIAKRRKSHKGKSTGFCPRCGKPILDADRFCPSCGKAIG
jgi:rubrerythrin